MKTNKMKWSFFVVIAVFVSPLLALANTDNLIIMNPGVETADPNDVSFPEGWENGWWGTNDTVFTYPVIGVDGSKAVQVEVTNYIDGDAKWFFGDMAVTSSEKYTFSDLYRSNVPADIVARYTLLSGDYQYVYLGTSVISTDWTGYSTLPFTTPEGVVSLTIFHLIHEDGILAVDNVSLRRYEVPVVSSQGTISGGGGGGAVPVSYLGGTAVSKTIKLASNENTVPSLNTTTDDGGVPQTNSAEVSLSDENTFASTTLEDEKNVPDQKEVIAFSLDSSSAMNELAAAGMAFQDFSLGKIAMILLALLLVLFGFVIIFRSQKE